MGLASKLGTQGGAPPGAGPSAPPMPGGGGFGGAATPPGYPQIGGQAPPNQSNAQQFGRPSQASPYGAPPTQSTPLGGVSQSNLGAQQGQQFQGGRPQIPGQPGQFGQQGSQAYGQQTPPFGQQNQGFGQPNFGQQSQPYGQQNQSFGQNPPFGQPPNQFGGQPGQNQFGAQTGQGQYGGQTGQNQYTQPGVQGPQGFGGGAFSQQMVRQRLQKLVSENRLEAFYPPQRLDQVAQFVASKDVEGLGQRWRLPREVTADLVGLALYDICIYVDDSGSMAFEEGGERIDDMKAVLGRTADAATLFDTDGIVVRFMNSPVEGDGIHSEAEAAALIQQIRFSGTTPLGSSLDRKVLQPMVLSQARSGSMQKPVLVICITDGEPTGEPKDTVRQVVMSAKNQLANSRYGPGAVAFQFAQVGKDAAATRFLTSLDVDPVIGSMIDCTSYYEQEQEEYARKGINLDPSLYLVKLMVGGIDRSYDEGDEG